MDLKRLIIVCLAAGLWACALLATVTGCGSYPQAAVSMAPCAANAAPTLPFGTGSVKFTIHWPPRAKYLPASTDHLAITITGAGLSAPRVTTVPYGQNTVMIDDLPTGGKTAEISALESSGTLLAHRIVNFTIQSSQTTQTTGIHLGVTLEDSGLTPQTITVPAGTLLYWYNNGSSSYNFSATPAPFDGSAIAADSYAWFTFNQVGTFTYTAGALSGTVEVTGAPRIDSLTPANGIIGSTVTITGAGFGAEAGQSLILFNETIPAVSSFWSKTRIICTVPAGTATGAVTVTTAAGQSNTDRIFTVIQHQVTGLFPASGPPGTTVTVNGTGFGATQGSGMVKFYNNLTAAVTSWSSSRIVCTAPANTATGPVTVTLNGLESNNDILFSAGKCYALLVGINDYQLPIDLQYCVNDVNDMNACVTGSYYWAGGSKTLLTNSQATKSGIQDALANFTALVQPQDTFLFYYSGHGDQYIGHEFIIPTDFDWSVESEISEDELGNWLAELNTDNIIAIFDSCYSGGMTKIPGQRVKCLPPRPWLGEERGFSALSAGGFKSLQRSGWVVLMACDKNELSTEISTLQNGVYTYYLTEGLGNGSSLGPSDSDASLEISAQEAHAYAGTQVKSHGYSQNPQIYDGHGWALKLK